MVTEVREFSGFYEAEAYHQDYHKKNPMGYRQYRSGSGRDLYLTRIWKGKPKVKKPTPQRAAYQKKSDDELKKILTPLQYEVTRKDGTEPPPFVLFLKRIWLRRDMVNMRCFSRIDAEALKRQGHDNKGVIRWFFQRASLGVDPDGT